MLIEISPNDAADIRGLRLGLNRDVEVALARRLIKAIRNATHPYSCPASTGTPDECVCGAELKRKLKRR